MMYGAFELIHHDPKIWEKPDDFYPEHFLKEDGTVDSKKEGFMPFSVGENSIQPTNSKMTLDNLNNIRYTYCDN